MKQYKLIILAFILVFGTSCTFMYVPLIPANPQMREARFLLSDSKGLSLEEEQLRLDVTIKEIPESDWLAVQWFSPVSKEVASASQWLEIVEASSSESQELNFLLPEDITLTPGYWRAVVSYQGRLVRQFGFDYVIEEDVQEEMQEDSELSDDASLEANPDESLSEPLDEPLSEPIGEPSEDDGN